MTKDPVYAIDVAGVVHLWWPIGTDGFASCGLQRDDVVVFHVDNLATCMTCLAMQQEEASAEGALGELERQLAASLQAKMMSIPSSFIGYSPDDAIAMQNVHNALARFRSIPFDPGVYGKFKLTDDVK